MGHPILSPLLVPASWMYGLAIGLRNLLYNSGLLKSYVPDIPVVVIGNLLAGGTGKSPLVARLAEVLGQKYRVAVLTRGYGRTSRGFLVVGDQPDPALTGDEAAELRMLLPETLIVADGNRKRGILEIASGRHGQADLILMDDGFQHRRVKPGFSILLDDFNRPARKERLLPAGLRREPLSALSRANLQVVTKKGPLAAPGSVTGPVVLVTGIASASRLAESLRNTGLLAAHLQFPDHHSYTGRDERLIRQTWLETSRLYKDTGKGEVRILTTGKDYVKLRRLDGMAGLPVDVLPAPCPVSESEFEEIIKKIEQYVGENHRDR